MANEDVAFIVGVVVGGIIMLLLTFTLPNENTRLLAECEKDLPRSQSCILIAVENESE